ncbi:hypothetical protein PHISP_07669 [Aspergillus sp. HF37]|nr:hypothetical protein PHISP_07669 [Aspergillus sp. HF37]
MPRSSPRHSSAACLPRSHPGIQGFARATKPGAPAAAAQLQGKKKEGAQLPASPSRKRKLSELENVESASPTKIGGGEKKLDGEGTTTPTPSKSLRIDELALTTPTPRSGHYVRRSSTEGSPLKRSRTVVAVQQRQKRQQQEQQRQIRPSFLYDILNFHSSFLKALTLHSAHHGVSAAADLREFIPSIERLWRKRKVVARDLQRLVWIWDQGADSNCTGLSYRLANYGLGRVCLERVVSGGGMVDESRLQEQFERVLEFLWEKADDGETDDEDEGDEEEHEKGTKFFETLGLSPVHESLTPFTSFRKGQLRLQDLKGGVIRWKTEKLRTESAEGDAAPKPVETASTRRQGLWDRIKNKQLRQSKLPPPPSREMLLRRAAAERVEEVAGVLAMLRPAGSVSSGRAAAQRTPFRLETIIQNVQDSTRNPISTEEVEICLELLVQSGVAGQWVNVVTVKGVKSVVLKSSLDVSVKEIGARVGRMRVGWDDEVSFG